MSDTSDELSIYDEGTNILSVGIYHPLISEFLLYHRLTG